jgi:hypothetical protein
MPIVVVASATSIAVAGDFERRRRQGPAPAAMLGANPPRRVPKWLARIAAGEHIAMLMTETRAGSNAKAKWELSWEPAHASWR